MSRILLTGATGFLGSHLLHTFVEDGHNVTALKRSASNTWRLTDIEGEFTYANSDEICINDLLANQGYDAVIHTVCDYGRSGSSSKDMMSTNVIFGLEILQAAIQHHVRSFINADTLLPRSLNAYSLSKHQFTDWLKLLSDQIQVINLRLEHMYGPKDDPKKFVNWVMQQFDNNVARIPLTDGHQCRDFVYISDVVNAFTTTYTQSASLPQYSEFEVGSGETISVRHFVETLRTKYMERFPKCSSELGFGDVPLRENEQMAVSVDMTGLKSLGWLPKVSINNGLKMLIKEKE
jgi:nucleoside-diphosphate-sugar epimerase